MLLKAIYMVTLLQTITSYIITDDTVLQDLSSFLGLSDSYTTVDNAINNSNAAFTCKKLPIDASPSQKFDVDTGGLDCGWEIAAITYSCTNSRLSGLQLQLRSVVNTSLVKSTIALSSASTKIITIPKDVYISKITLGTATSLSRDFIVSLAFEMSNNTSAKITCYTPRTVTTMNLGSLERINGFYGNMFYGGFVSFGFYKHALVPKVRPSINAPAADYYDLMRSDKTKTYGDVSDNFIRVGPYGLQQGRFFEDPYLYGHWNITQMAISSTKNSIVSLQSYVVNSMFYYLQLTEVHGDKTPDTSQLKNVTVPEGMCISTVEFINDRNNNLIGVCFYFSNNTSTGYIGQAPNKPSGYTSIKYDVKSNQEVVGFFGYENDSMVNALGLLIVEKNDSTFYYR